MKTSLIFFVGILVFAGLAADASAQTLTIQSPLPNWTKGQAYAIPMIATGGLPPFTWTVSAGSIPPGLTLNALGLMSGAPTTVGSYGFTLRVTNLTGGSGTRIYTVVINDVPKIDQTTLPKARVDEGYTTTITVSKGTSPYGFLLVSGALPPGLALSGITGTISGTPTKEGDYGFTIRATDSAFAMVDQAYTLKVVTGPRLERSGTTIWTVDRPGFDLRITASAGDGAIEWDDPTGVPPGLSWSRVGNVLSVTGTPTALGISVLSTTVRDATGAENSLETVITVNPPPVITTDTLPDATDGSPYDDTLGADQGAPPFTWRLVSSSAGWLGVDSGAGGLRGTPDATGKVDVTVEVRDDSGATAEKQLHLMVNPAPALGDDQLPLGIPDEPYAADLPLTGGTAPFTAAIQTGSLPAGLAIDGSRISGTPTGAGHQVFDVRVTDRWGAAALGRYSITVARKIPIRSKLPESALVAGAREAFVFDVIEGTLVTLKLKVPFGTAGLAVRLTKLDGTVINVVPHLKLGKKSISLKKVPVPETGRIALTLIVVGDRIAKYRGKITGKAAKGMKVQLGWGPTSGEREFPFSALKGAKITVVAKAAGKGVPAAALVSLTGPDGGPVDIAPFLKPTKGGFKIAGLVAVEGGDFLLRVRPDGAGAVDGALKLTVKIRSPKDYIFTYAP